MINAQDQIDETKPLDVREPDSDEGEN